MNVLNNIDWGKVIPVLVSIGVIIAIAILRQYSKTIAAIAATMPINVPLGMWIVYSGGDNKQASLAEFNQAVMINIVPTVVFIFVAWQLSKAGQGAVPSIFGGYVAWAVCLGLIYVVRAQIGA